MTGRDTRANRSGVGFFMGLDWVWQGVLSAGAGVDIVLASLAEPVRGLDTSIQRYRKKLDSAGIAVDLTDSDEVTAGLIRAGLRAGRRCVAVFDERGLRQGLDALFEASRAQTSQDAGLGFDFDHKYSTRAANTGNTRNPVHNGAGAVVVACESRWTTVGKCGNAIDMSTPLSQTQYGNRSEGVNLDAVGSDLRDLAIYLGWPILLPSNPAEVKRDVSEAMRLSRLSGRVVMVWLTPALVGSGETAWDVADPAMRGIPMGKEVVGETVVPPIIHEARRRQIDHVLNAPAPGETVPLGFIACSTAFSSLRHALWMNDLTGKIPILKIGLCHPVDPRPIKRFITQCREVVLVEGGSPIVTRAVMDIAEKLQQSGQTIGNIQPLSTYTSLKESSSTHTRSQKRELPDRLSTVSPFPPVRNRPGSTAIPQRLPQKQSQFRSQSTYPNPESHSVDHVQRCVNFISPDWHPSDMMTLLNKVLKPLQSKQQKPEITQKGGSGVEESAAFGPHADVHKQILSHMSTTVERRRGRGLQGGASRCVISTMLLALLDDLRDELLETAPTHPSLNLVVEHVGDTTFETGGDKRTVIEIDRRRWPGVGRTAVAHAIRRHLPMTFLVLHDPPDATAGMLTSEVDRSARSLIASHEATRTTVSTLDPTDAAGSFDVLKKAVLFDGVSIIIIDTEHIEGMSTKSTKSRSSTTQRAVALTGKVTNTKELATSDVVVAVTDEQLPIDRTGSEFPKSSVPFDETLGDQASDTDEPRVESHVRPHVDKPKLMWQWMLKHGFKDALYLDGIHGPKVDDITNEKSYITTPLDAWDGFEEIRVHRTAGANSGSLAQITTRLTQDNSVKTQNRSRFYASHKNTKQGTIDLPEPDQKHGNKPIWYVHICGYSGIEFESTVQLLVQTGRRMGYRVILLEGRDQIGMFAQIGFSKPRPDEPSLPITAHIPRGEADLILSMTNEPLVIADQVIGGEHAGEICDRLLNNRRLIGAFMVGLAFQTGSIPVTWDSLKRAGRLGFGEKPDSVVEALHLGRYQGAGILDAVLPDADDQRVFTPEQLIRRHSTILAAKMWFNANKRAGKFRDLALGTLDAITGLRRDDRSRSTETEFVARLIDCERWGGLRYAKEYAERVRLAYAAERSTEGYPITRMIVRELAHAMLIPDPVFIAATCTRADRIRNDERRLRIDRRMKKGERISYRIRGRFPVQWANTLIGGHWKLTSRSAAVVATMRWVRFFPGWYRKDRHIREWVVNLVDRSIEELPKSASVWFEIYGQMSRLRGTGASRGRIFTRVRLAVNSLLHLASSSAVQSDTPQDFERSS